MKTCARFKWPHGTPPEDFKRDVEALALMTERVTYPQKDFQWRRHPLFDELSERDWMRWGYLHVDHHLRQFGV